ncbi:MAG: CoA transferase [Streptosporangiales bacterium]|nr:CoA transferase [Streptosporangiales bacterium]
MTESDSSKPAGLPLAGVRILDLTRVLAGPFATCILGDLGADVIKIEEPDGGDQVRTIAPFYDGRQSHYFLAINRNKRSVVVDLKRPGGAEVVLDLAAHCDVVIENFRPGVLDRLGLGFDALVARKPDVILCSISGYGQTGPLRDKPSFDLVTQARSGVMSITGATDGPPTKLGLPMGDLAGGLWGAIAVLSALQRRTTSAAPQHIDLSLLEGLAGLLGYLGQLSLMTGESPGRVGSGHHSIAPYGRFEVADGHLVLALHVGTFWRRFCAAVGRQELVEDPRFRTTADRRDNRDELQEIVSGILRARTRAEWERILDEADVPYGPILDVVEALEQEQFVARDILFSMHHPTAGDVPMVRPPIRFVGEALAASTGAAPLLGQHTREVLREVLHWDDARIDGLESESVLGTAADHTVPAHAADEVEG